MELSGLNTVIIGSGIGGLAAGALLASRGALVTVLEAQGYPGGCAATFARQGYRFDAGATVGCGFHPGGPMDMLGRELGITWPVRQETVAWRYCHGSLTLDLDRQGSGVLERFPESRAFWQEQSVLSALLWKLAAGGLPWPPASIADLALLLRKGFSGFPGTSRLLHFAAKTAYEWLVEHRLETNAKFMRFIDAQLLISAQATSREANAVNAAIALDLPFSGAWHIEGGIGRISEQLALSIEQHGGTVLYRERVERMHTIRRQVFGVETSGGLSLAADLFLANLTPASLALLAGISSDSPLLRQKGPVHRWGTVTLYLGLDAAIAAGAGERHLQIIGQSGNPGEGNSIFASFSMPGEEGRAPRGCAAVTVSTHSRPEPWFAAVGKSREEYLRLKSTYIDKMLDLLALHIPGLREGIRFLEAGTPLTWERYTGRHRGYVGGYPQTSLFDVRDPATGFDNMLLVGDSVFPGQSLPGVVTGARRVVELAGRGVGSR